MTSVAMKRALWMAAAAVALALVLTAWHDPHFVAELADQLWACF